MLVQLSRQEVVAHDPVPAEGESRILERGRLVFLEEEVADPGEEVPRHEAEQLGVQATREEPINKRGKAAAGAEVVKVAANFVHVLREVEGIKLLESPEILVGHTCSLID